MLLDSDTEEPAAVTRVGRFFLFFFRHKFSHFFLSYCNGDQVKPGLGPDWLSDRAIREQGLRRLLHPAGPQEQGVAGQGAGRGSAGLGQRCLQEELG